LGRTTPLKGSALDLSGERVNDIGDNPTVQREEAVCNQESGSHDHATSSIPYQYNKFELLSSIEEDEINTDLEDPPCDIQENNSLFGNDGSSNHDVNSIGQLKEVHANNIDPVVPDVNLSVPSKDFVQSSHNVSPTLNADIHNIMHSDTEHVKSRIGLFLAWQ